jgi:hypothetical protein
MIRLQTNSEGMSFRKEDDRAFVFVIPECSRKEMNAAEHEKIASGIIRATVASYESSLKSGKVYACAQCRKISDRTSMKRCGKCKAAPATYCSVDCQRQDWATHKLTCKPREAE